MRIAVIGTGSIGRRHIANLHRLSQKEIFAFDPHFQPGATSWPGPDVQLVHNLADLWLARPDVAFICSPSALHMTHALDAARHGCHIFIEKPLSTTLTGLAELQSLVTRSGLVSLVGCNMRFHPGPARVRQAILAGHIGKIYSARVLTGSYLPGWRPQTDYRASYSANAKLGGGCILDCIHEIDLARWYFGPVAAVTCVAGHVSRLEIDVEDVAALICRHDSGVISEIHLDYFQRPAARGCEVYGELGTIAWNMELAGTRLFSVADNTWQNLSVPEQQWEINDMYVDEIRHFLNCIATNTETICPVADAAEVIKIALSARQSALSGRTVVPAAMEQAA